MTMRKGLSRSPSRARFQLFGALFVGRRDLRRPFSSEEIGRLHAVAQMAVPLLLRGPGLPAGAVSDVPVSLIDVLPTVMAMLGVDAPAGVDGLDLRPAWRTPGAQLTPRALFAEADHSNADPDVVSMIRRGAHKLTQDRLARTTALFDLSADPGEQDDRAAELDRLHAELLVELERFRAGGREGVSGSPLSEQEQDALRALGYVGDDEED